MNVPVDRIKDVVGAPRQGRTTFRALSFSAVAAVLAVLAFFAINTGPADASAGISNSVDLLHTRSDTINAIDLPDAGSLHLPVNGLYPMASFAPGILTREADQSASHAGFESAWLAPLAVGMDVDSNTGHTRYSMGSPRHSEALGLATFEYNGVPFVPHDNFLRNFREGVSPLLSEDNPSQAELNQDLDGALTLQGANPSGPQSDTLGWPRAESLKWH